MNTKIPKHFGDGDTVDIRGPGKKDEVISKEKVRYLGALMADENGVPVQKINFIVNPSRQKFHASDEDAG